MMFESAAEFMAECDRIYDRTKGVIEVIRLALGREAARAETPIIAAALDELACRFADYRCSARRHDLADGNGVWHFVSTCDLIIGLRK